MRYIFLSITVLLTILLAGLHAAAYEYYLYWSYWWYDILMHGLGGVTLASIALWFYLYQAPESFTSAYGRLTFTLAVVIILGLGWELFEFFVGSQIYQTERSYIIDTIADMGMDVAGGLMAYLATRYIR